MPPISHDLGSGVFWCNTNRWNGDGGDYLEQQMLSRKFAAAWTEFRYPKHMLRVRCGSLIFMYAHELGVIGVGRATESRLELLFPDHPDRLRDEEDFEEEWRVPVEWLKWDVANPCILKPLRPSFQDISGDKHKDRVETMRRHFHL